ncbi:MAG: class D sortase [Anaerolineales bacterium]|jgi:sortase A|nr:class D sortase [Anaerolineales bacterium]MCW5838552.1 class D sortase [Anaerolineales bacterium]MCW5888175.1 class D sortase [Anaerolineales bacterium]
MAKKSKTLHLEEGELRRMLLERRSADRKRRVAAYAQAGELLPLDAEATEGVVAEPLAGTRIHADADLRLAPPKTSRARLWVERSLLVIELLAVAGLGYIFLNGLDLLGQLNTEVNTTPSAAPLLGPVVLPSGHTAPSAGNAAAPNEAEIPEHLRPLVQAYTAALVLPTPGPEQALGISIPRLGLNAPVVQGDDWEALKRGVGQHIGSANPGENGNLVLSGHNDIYGEVFRHLDQLEPGDEIVILTAETRYIYTVTQRQLVAPTFVEVMFPTTDATITLISCYPYMINTQRIIIKGELSGIRSAS